MFKLERCRHICILLFANIYMVALQKVERDLTWIQLLATIIK